jgi:hypothetical protein
LFLTLALLNNVSCSFCFCSSSFQLLPQDWWGVFRNILFFFAGVAIMYANQQPAAVTNTLVGSAGGSNSAASAGAQKLSDVAQPTKSLHPKWKLWHEMTTGQQAEALKELQPYLKKYGHLLKDKVKWQGQVNHGDCELKSFGIGAGHQLCGPAPPADTCTFISFGSNDDPSFDQEIATEWGCRGFAGDPTVDLKSHIHPKVTFHNLGATLVTPNEERRKNKGTKEEWWSTSMPSLRKFLGLERIEIMKLDCEGCEVALARDILAEDPDFLTHIDQISIETHVTRFWINSTEHLYYFALQFPLLEEVGHKLEFTSIFGWRQTARDRWLHSRVGDVWLSVWFQVGDGPEGQDIYKRHLLPGFPVEETFKNRGQHNRITMKVPRRILILSPLDDT